MDNRLTFGVIHIVEWLPPGDLHTGRELFDELQPMGDLSRPPVDVDFRAVSTRTEFLELLQSFEAEFRRTGRIPVLHVETHGSADGIGASEEEGILWRELMDALIPLNRATAVNLVVILAACEGLWGIQMLQLDRRAAAFRGLIGPNRQLEAGQLQRGCLAFYRAVFRQGNGDEALRAMNDEFQEEIFWLVSPETAFKQVYRNYLKQQCSPEALERRAAAVAANIGRRRRADGLPGRYKAEIERDREISRRYLSDHRARFEELRREFFFIDEYPDNARRFDFTFDDCQPE